MSADHAYAEWDAAYVLGALTPAERREFEGHLDACDRCRAAVADLASLPGLLSHARPLVEGEWRDDARVDDARVDDAPSRTGPRADLVAAIERREARRARGVRARIVLAVAGAAAAGALAFALPSALTPTAEPTATVALAAVAPVPLAASVDLESVAWGTRLSMTCDYATTDPRYRANVGELVLVVTDRAGRDSQVSTWTAVPGKEITLEAGTALALEDIAALEVRTADGDTVLAASLPG